MSSSINEKFEKVKASWKCETKVINYGDLSKKAVFSIAYHAANEVPFRCIDVIIKPGDNDAGNYAVLYSSLDKIFTAITGTDANVSISMYVESDEVGFSKLASIEEKTQLNMQQFATRTPKLKDQIIKTMLVERKIDEVVNLAMNKDLARKVYFAVGEARERGAEIPLMMSAPKADVVQLAMMKWMNAALNCPQDEKFPDLKVKGLVKNFLQLKKWLIDLIDRSFTSTEEELIPKQQGIED